MEDRSPRAIDEVIAMAEYKSARPNMLELHPGETVYVLQKKDNGWWDGCIIRANDDGTTGQYRGWFPSNHTKSRQQIALEEHKHPKSMSSLLRQNLGEDPRRKDSGVSFNSHDSSQSYGSVSKAPPQQNIQWATAQEAEAMFSASGSSKVPVWVPQAWTDGTIIYYNAELNIHCRELPFFQAPDVDESSTISVPRSQTLANIMMENDSVSPLNTAARPSTATAFTTFTNTDSSTSHYVPRQSVSRSSVNSGGTSTVHPWNSSLYCVPDLFYYDPTDITTWPALRDAFCYFLTLTLDALTKKNGPLFYTYFNIASRLGVLVNLAARLAQHDLQKTGYHNRVQRRLKKISGGIAQVGLNGNLYLTDDSSFNDSTGDRTLSTSTQETLKLDSDEPAHAIEELNSQTNYLQRVTSEIESLKRNAITCVKVFVQISSNQGNEQALLPQVYPRFLTGFFSGANWRNPFVPEPQDPFSGKEVVKSLHHRRVESTLLTKETLGRLELKRDKLTQTLNNVLTALRGKENSQQRNVDVLSEVHKSLALSAKFIDVLEGLDFSIFLKANILGDDANEDLEDLFDPSKLVYPILTEFFEAKQNLRDVFVSIIMDAQSLTLADPTVFRSIREDAMDGGKPITVEPEKSAKQLEIELQKLDIEGDDGISVDVDRNLEATIMQAYDCLDVCLALVAQLISEREAYLNYATRVMNADGYFDLITPNAVPQSREDSTMTTNDEYALPASSHGRYNRYGQSEDVDTPWYLSAEEYELIFTANDAVKGGTREALVQRLTHHDLLDAHFNVTFLTTFRSIFNTTALVNALIKRFKIEPPENLSYEEYSDWVAKKAYPVKLRTVNIMKSLLQKHWNPAYNEPGLYRLLGDFIDELLVQSFPGSEQLKREFTRKVTMDVIEDDELSKEVHDEDENLPISSKTRKMRLLDIDPQQLANQLTVKESRLYNNITQSECLAKAWGTKYGPLGGYPHLQRFIANSNDLTNWVSSQILLPSDPKKRVLVIKYFVTVAEKCRLLNNFSSMTAILSALYASPIHRLKKTWKYVPEPTMTSMNSMNSLMNSTRNFAEYREHLRFIADRPCVPFLGVFLSDLTFIQNGNSDVLHGDTKLVNFAKRTKTLDVLRELSRYKNLKYNIKKNNDVQDFVRFQFKNLQSIEEQYSRSLAIEPRIKVAQQIQQKGAKKKSKQTFGLPSFAMAPAV